MRIFGQIFATLGRYRVASLGIPFNFCTDILQLTIFSRRWIILEIGCEPRWPAGLGGGLESLSWSCHRNVWGHLPEKKTSSFLLLPVLWGSVNRRT